ncbi:Ulp1 family isopeptidase [Rhizobium leguminosarum]|uniref:Ulp1 family isopeptidase n=1 Tax=Rhizobium leguminosarum TaxID=384 RepID=UPI0036DB0862
MKNSQRRFGAWLRANQKPSIESRLNSGQQQFAELKKDLKKFREAVKQSPGSGLDRLQKYQQVVKANEAWGMQPAKEAGWPQQPGQSPVSTYDQDQLWDEVSTPYELRDDARSAPAWDSEPSSAGPSTSTSTLTDIGFRLGGWHHGSRRASRSEINILEISNVAPSPYVPTTSFLIDGELYTAEWQPGGIVNFIHHSEGGQASGSRALGDTEWLGDEHIAADYLLLEAELRRSNPELFARTRFVNPLVAQVLRQGDESSYRNQLGALLRGDIRVDFLFLPMNDASRADRNRRGSHWSLLFVDLRPPTGPVAYHYDSAGQYNRSIAAELAYRLGANLVQPRMTQQTNSHDCGVFVLAATREMAQRLQQGQPELDLDNLVADRQALRNRLQP